MPPRCDHDPSEHYKSSQGWWRCRACDRIRSRRSRGRPDTSPVPKPPGSPGRAVADEKPCIRCERVQALSEYYNNPRAGDGKHGTCRTCWRAAYATPEQNRRATLRKYGIEPEEYDALLARQDGGCAICGALPETQQHGVLPVDHDHATGANRGLLCHSCNNGLGRFHDDVRLLRAAIAYLG